MMKQKAIVGKNVYNRHMILVTVRGKRTGNVFLVVSIFNSVKGLLRRKEVYGGGTFVCLSTAV